MFYSYSDKIKQDYFINRMQDPKEQENARRKLGQVIQFFQLQTCRRKYLLEYFDERIDNEECGGRDVCLTTKEEFYATVISQKILSAVIRTGERFGARHIVDVLRGSATQKVRNTGHHDLKVFGIAGDSSTEDLKHTITALLTKELLAKARGNYPTLSVTQTGRSFLKNRGELTLQRLTPAPSTDL